ncbi:MAG: FitA-like ribbon-helix-helix domain-containing protein [Gammaproteobacteria bacterium]
MPTLTLRDLPEDLHDWLKRQAEAHHRSVNKEVIALLGSLRTRPERALTAPGSRRSAAALRRCRCSISASSTTFSATMKRACRAPG